jgi:cytochrome c553
MMADAVRFLSDDALIKVAAWYATLDPAQPAPPVTAGAAARDSDPADAGRKAAAGCAGCHGEAGISRIPGMPNLAGLDPRYLQAATNAYKSGRRRHDMMKALVIGLNDTHIMNIASFYAAQVPGRAQTPATGNKDAGKGAAKTCVACHGADGVSTGLTPSLAGQEAQYFVSAMRAYRDGSRAEPVMKGPATATSDAALGDLAAYYASLPPRPPKLTAPPTMAEWAERCDRCHGTNGNSTDPRVPALAAQRADYLERALNAYRTGARASTAMSAMSKVLTESDVALLAAHYSAQKARAVVYVMLPVKK